MTDKTEERLIAAINLNTWMTSRQILLKFYTTDLRTLPESSVRNATKLVIDVAHVIDQIENIYKPKEDEE